MLKSIKKSFKYLAILMGIILLVPTSFYLLIRIPEVQTFVVNRITGHFSDEIKSKITVGRIEYSFFNKLVVKDLLIKDVNNDTLVYSFQVSLGIRSFDFRNKVLRFGQAELTSPVFELITDTAGMMNLKGYLTMLKKPGNQGKKGGSIFSINQILIHNGKFLLINKTGKEPDIPVNFKDLHISGIDGSIEDLRVQNDSTVFNINGLAFSESSGFTVKRMSANVLISGNDLMFKDLLLNCSNSLINADYVEIMADGSESYSRFFEEVRLNISLLKSQISSTDLKYFVPFLDGYDEMIGISGKLSGTLAQLKGRNLQLTYRNNTNLDCDFDLSGLPEFRDAFIYVGVNSLHTNAEDFSLLKTARNKNFVVPGMIRDLGNISFNGSFTGFINDFVAYGRLGTDKGDLLTDISLRPDEQNRFKVKGLVRGINISLGQLLNKPDLFGNLSMETNLDGYATSSRRISGSITGRIDSIEVNKYMYRNISLNGIFTEKTWDGSIKISDENIKMDLLGMFDFSSSLPEFDFTMNLAESDLFDLNFDKSDSTAYLAMLLTANFRGNNIDNLIGEIKMLNSTLRKYNTSLELYDFSLRTFNENNKPAISLKTDFADAELRGYYNFREFPYIFRKVLSMLLPAKFSPPDPEKELTRNNFSFALYFKNSDKINKFLRTGILLSEKSTLTGSFYPDSVIRVGLKAGKLTYRQNTFNNLTLNSILSDSTFSTAIRSSYLSILGKSELRDFRIDINVVPDNFIVRLNWDNQEKLLNKGSFRASGSLFRKDDDKNGTRLGISIDSSDIYAGGQLWRISESNIKIDSNAVEIDKFTITSGENFYLIDGNITGNADDTLKLEFKGIDLNFLNQLGQKETKNSEDRIPFNIKGIIDGNISVSNALKSPLVESNLTVRGFSLLGGEYGDVYLTSVWNASKKVADINARNNYLGVRNLDMTGFYDPVTKRIALNAKTDSLPVDALNPLLGFFASGITGTVSGKIRLLGEINKPVLTGSLMAENVSMKVNYLQTTYKVNDSIRFDRTGIKFRNLRFIDEKGKNATLTGSVNHQYFEDFKADLVISMNDCLVLNTQERDNEMFYGTAYATGVTTIKSEPGLLSFDISATTGRNTQIFIPLNSGLSVSEYSFVRFVNPDTAGKEVEATLVQGQMSSVTGLEINMDLNVTPDAEVQLLIDPKAGDVIKGNGEGSLNINLTRKGDLRITGEYTIEEGDYLFTLGNIFNKRFDVESGGKVTFNGDLENAEIDLKAAYKNLKASLYPILGDDRYTERISVEPRLNLSGNLLNPFVGFEIYLPNADEETRTYLNNAITTDEELSRQFLFLLVMNSFYSDQVYRSLSGTTASSTSAMAATTTEMVSNQLSNWLSQISNDFDIGFNYRPGNKDINSQEVQVALSTQILNDRVLINGNFGVGNAAESYGNAITGDFDIEYKLTEKIRFKVFNRYNSPTTGRGEPYTQGVGLFFKQDFNRFSDLFRKPDKSGIKKEDDVTVE